MVWADGVHMRWVVMMLWALTWPALAEPARVLLGVGTHKPPYIFEGEARGLEYEIVTAALREAGVQVEVRHAPAERLAAMLNSGTLDAVAGLDSDGGGKRYLSQRYLSSQAMAVALARDGLEINSVADLQRYSVNAFQRARYALGQEFSQVAQAHPQYRESSSQITGGLMLYAERVQVAIIDPLVFAHLREQMDERVSTAAPLRWYRIFEPLHYQVSFRDRGLRDRFDQGLTRLKETGVYQQIVQRYLPTYLTAER